MSGQQVGMLWFDNDPKTETLAKVAKAVSYYSKKFGLRPTWVEMNVRQLTGEEALVICEQMKIAVRVSNKVLPNHFWIGEGNTDEHR